MGLKAADVRSGLLAGASVLLLAGAAQAQARDDSAAAQLSLGRIVVSAGAEKVELLLHDEVSWPTVAVARQLSLMMDDWTAASY